MLFVRIGVFLLALLAAVACTTPAPLYQTSVDNVLTLKRARSSGVTVGSFTAAKEAEGTVRLRADGMTSPYSNSFAEYLREALRQELAEAEILKSTASIEIGGVLLENYVSAADFKVGNAKLTARFVVKNRDRVNYDRTIAATHQWDSAFMGAYAISTARDNYRFVVQKLLKQLYADPDFITAIK